MTALLTLPMDVCALIPQKDPMRFVDRLLAFQDRRAEVEALVAKDNPMLDADGRLDPAGFLELMAQSCAAVRGYEDSAAGGPIKLGFLVGVRRMNVTGAAHSGDRLLIRSETVGYFDGFSIVDVEVARGEDVLATGTLKLWVTDDTSLLGPRA